MKKKRLSDKLRSLSFRDLLFLFEAYVLIFLAAIAIRFVPFKHVLKLASAPIRRPVEDRTTQDYLSKKVAWAVDRAAKRSKLRALCFERGLTAQVMLRMRSVDATLYYGVAPDANKGLIAHVWVIACGHDITGTEVANRFATLATFPKLSH